MANEDALRDSNRTPTLLIEQGGEVKRVSSTTPMPVAVVSGLAATTRTVTVEVTGTVVQTIATPATGKKFIVTASMIRNPPKAVQTILRFAGGKLVNKTYVAEHSGQSFEGYDDGAVNEAIIVETVNFAAGDKALVKVNLQEV